LKNSFTLFKEDNTFEKDVFGTLNVRKSKCPFPLPLRGQFDKGGAVVVWPTDFFRQEAFRQLSYTSFYAKVDKDLPSANQRTVKKTIQDLIDKQELPFTAKKLIVTTPRTPRIYFKPKIQKPNNPGRPVVSACSCPTELISSYRNKK